MATKRRILTVTLLIAILGFASWLLLSQPGEPVYQGKPLSDWCDQYANRQLRDQAGIAIRAIGTNAIPIFLRWLNAKDSKIKIKFIQFTQKQHLIDIKFRTAEVGQLEAISGFVALGNQGKSTLPSLLEIYRERPPGPYNDPAAIAGILASMGPAAADAVPLLVQDTTNTNVSLRFNAVLALGQIHARMELAVPALTSSLRDPSLMVRIMAPSSLAAFGTDAKSAVPELIKALDDPFSTVREEAASALQKIDPEAAAKAGVK